MEIVLLWCFVLAWMAKRGTEDLVHAVKGTPNPRYEAKKAKAKAAGQRPPQQPRYGGREWIADLMSDAMVAHTQKRRVAAKAKAQPVDDMVDVVREPVPAQRRPAQNVEHGEPEWLTPAVDEVEFLSKGRRLCPDCGVVLLDELSDGSTRCPHCGPEQVSGPHPVLAPTRTFGSPEEREAMIRKIQETALAKSAEWGTQVHRDSSGRCTTCGAPNPFDTPCSSHNPDFERTAGDGEAARSRCSYGGPETQFGKGRGQCAADALPGKFFCAPHGAEVAKVNAATAALCSYVADGKRCRNLRDDVTDPQQRYGFCEDHKITDRSTQTSTTLDDQPTAQIIQFPNIHQFQKEITMSNSEVTSLSTAMAYASLASKAHESFAAAGAEPYVSDLESAGMTGGAVASAREAAEASGIAADKWAAHRSLLEQQMTIKEAYASQPDAANKEFLLNG